MTSCSYKLLAMGLVIVCSLKFIGRDCVCDYMICIVTYKQLALSISKRCGYLQNV